MSDYHTSTVSRMSLLQLAWPMFIEWLLTVTIGMVDAMILGYISDEAAAAVGGVNVLLILAITLLGTLAGSGGIVLTQYLGGQRRQALPDLYRSLLLINLLAGAALSLLMLLGSPLLPALLIMPASLHQDATRFAAIVGGGLMAQSLVWIFSAILNAHGQTRVTMANSLTMNISNALLSLYLVTHTDYGVAGVAWATVLCRLAGALNLYLQVRWRLHIALQITPSSWRKPLLWRPIARIALPACLEPLSYYGNQAVLTALMASLGIAALAAKSYVLSMVALIEVAAFAISQAAQILTGHLTGAGEWHQANRRKWQAVRYAIGFTLLCSLPFLYWRHELLGLFTRDPQIIALGEQLLQAAVVVAMLKAYNFVAGSCLRAAGDATFTAGVTLLCMWIICVPLGYLFAFPLGYGMVGIWLALAVDELCRAVLMAQRWHSGRWQSKVLAPTA